MGQETLHQIAVDDPGLYRIVRAETAVFVAVSGKVPVAEDQFAAQAVYPRVAAGRPVTLVLRSACADKPLANAKVLVSGPYSFEPVEARTSADGEVVLESVNVDQIRVEAAGQIRYKNLGPAESTAHLAF